MRAEAAVDDVCATAEDEWDVGRIGVVSRSASLREDEDEEADRGGGMDLPNE